MYVPAVPQVLKLCIDKSCQKCGNNVHACRNKVEWVTLIPYLFLSRNS